MYLWIYVLKIHVSLSQPLTLYPVFIPQYVLKKLDLHNASKRERRAAELEAKLLSKLKHPNIVSYKDSFESGKSLLDVQYNIARLV